ncbi:MAG: tRNA (adenosine(37)-N6)-dimethylallyltransferase MiaA [Candidatus Saccharimonadales bacterium]
MASLIRPKPLLVIIGETASGKSEIALNIARHINAEIICADSGTVYREFDIGTAKPTNIELQAIPHHLVNIVDPTENFNGALFKSHALIAIDDIHNRHKIPIIVGGTGLYIDSLLFDYSFLPPADLALRQTLQAKTIKGLMNELEVRNINVGNTDICNKRRLIRLIETGGQQPLKKEMRKNTLVIGIQRDHDFLHKRIVDRVDTMIKLGLEKEVLQLSNKYGWNVSPMKGIGYKEWFEYYEDSKRFDQTREHIITSTLHYAKRQRTWFRRNPRIQWVNDPNEIMSFVTTFLNNYQ